MTAPLLTTERLTLRRPDSRDETWSMRPEVLADLLWSALNQPGHLVLDELAAHPLHQDF